MIKDEFIELIEQSEIISIFSHVSADGDAVGSSMAIKLMLDNLGKKTHLFLEEPISENYYFTNIDKVANKTFADRYDLAIVLDCPNTKRLGIYEREVNKSSKIINIDHHPDNANYGTLNIINSSACSASEIVYKHFKDLNLKIDKYIATCLYCGISTDTGRFLNNNTTCTSLIYAGELASLGADIDSVNYNLFTRKTMREFDLYKYGLNNAEFFEDGKIVFVGITDEVLKQTSSSPNDTFRIMDFIRGIENVEIAVVMTQSKPKENKVSVRTINKNAQNICKQFGGGGHIKASGCKIFTTFENAKQMLIKECVKELKLWKVEL